MIVKQEVSIRKEDMLEWLDTQSNGTLYPGLEEDDEILSVTVDHIDINFLIGSKDDQPKQKEVNDVSNSDLHCPRLEVFFNLWRLSVVWLGSEKNNFSLVDIKSIQEG